MISEAKHCRVIKNTPLGPLLACSEGGVITQLDFIEPHELEQRLGEESKTLSPLLTQLEEQLNAYFAGTLKQFTLPLAPAGTVFQQTVWAALESIPYGETWSYKQLAEAVQRPKGFQAVGQANGRNPIVVIIPCHRVIAANGSLGGYGGGLERKQKLLKLERSKCR